MAIYSIYNALIVVIALQFLFFTRLAFAQYGAVYARDAIAAVLNARDVTCPGGGQCGGSQNYVCCGQGCMSVRGVCCGNGYFCNALEFCASTLSSDGQHQCCSDDICSTIRGLAFQIFPFNSVTAMSTAATSSFTIPTNITFMTRGSATFPSSPAPATAQTTTTLATPSTTTAIVASSSSKAAAPVAPQNTLRWDLPLSIVVLVGFRMAFL